MHKDLASKTLYQVHCPHCWTVCPWLAIWPLFKPRHGLGYDSRFSEEQLEPFSTSIFDPLKLTTISNRAREEVVSKVNWPLHNDRFEIIAKRGIIARFGYNTSFRLYE